MAISSGEVKGRWCSGLIGWVIKCFAIKLRNLGCIRLFLVFSPVAWDEILSFFLPQGQNQFSARISAEKPSFPRRNHLLRLNKVEEMDGNHQPQKFFGAKLDVAEIRKQSFGVNNVPSSWKGGSTKPSPAQNHCLCSPTTHRGSFRCRHHRNSGASQNSGVDGSN
ncbi:uncharacterized protein LOC111378611 [Olea europaea var. sylvestris]|uniref:uncharacterized protein LOC111378611 n=1 Tax=Olea europaea var. sylvestris TaxID=158386 RepID=UPI000C1D3FC2|nr:uncharacterized protein LOC111378611 [Olea europaea var. sylvestris]